MTAPILGIDFGTTNTAACFFDENKRLRLVPVKEKQFLLPSVVWFHAGDKAIVGQAARTQIIDDPRHTLFGVKRFLGRRFQSEFVSRNKDRFAFQIVEGPDTYAAVNMYGKVHSLTSVAEQIFSQILTLANHTANQPFKECVLTVPAHASIKQREATRQAAENVGLKVRAMINEPTAAALYYANLRSPEQTVLVFDLGGGTLDVTLLSVQNRVVKVLATGGDAFLGGANFDERIVEVLVEDFERRNNVVIRDNKVVMQRLVFAAESAKIILSSKDQTRLRVPCITQRDGNFIHFDYELNRKQLDQILAPLVERAAGAVEDVLQRAGLKSDQIDELVLVGGQTRMPAIRQRFQHFRRSSNEKDVHPDLGVAIGAAILGRNLGRTAGTGLSDVVPMPIGVMAPGAGSVEVIPANTPVPAAKTILLDKLPPAGPVALALFEAVDRTSVDRELLGTIQIPPEWRDANRGVPSLELRMGQDFVLSAAVVSERGARLVLPIAGR